MRPIIPQANQVGKTAYSRTLESASSAAAVRPGCSLTLTSASQCRTDLIVRLIRIEHGGMQDRAMSALCIAPKDMSSPMRRQGCRFSVKNASRGPDPPQLRCRSRRPNIFPIRVQSHPFREDLPTPRAVLHRRTVSPKIVLQSRPPLPPPCPHLPPKPLSTTTTRAPPPTRPLPRYHPRRHDRHRCPPLGKPEIPAL